MKQWVEPTAFALTRQVIHSFIFYFSFRVDKQQQQNHNLIDWSSRNFNEEWNDSDWLVERRTQVFRAWRQIRFGERPGNELGVLGIVQAASRSELRSYGPTESEGFEDWNRRFETARPNWVRLRVNPKRVRNHEQVPIQFKEKAHVRDCIGSSTFWCSDSQTLREGCFGNGSLELHAMATQVRWCRTIDRWSHQVENVSEYQAYGWQRSQNYRVRVQRPPW